MLFTQVSSVFDYPGHPARNTNVCEVYWQWFLHELEWLCVTRVHSMIALGAQEGSEVHHTLRQWNSFCVKSELDMLKSLQNVVQILSGGGNPANRTTLTSVDSLSQNSSATTSSSSFSTLNPSGIGGSSPQAVPGKPPSGRVRNCEARLSTGKRPRSSPRDAANAPHRGLHQDKHESYWRLLFQSW